MPKAVDPIATPWLRQALPGLTYSWACTICGRQFKRRPTAAHVSSPQHRDGLYKQKRLEGVVALRKAGWTPLDQATKLADNDWGNWRRFGFTDELTVEPEDLSPPIDSHEVELLPNATADVLRAFVYMADSERKVLTADYKRRVAALEKQHDERMRELVMAYHQDQATPEQRAEIESVVAQAAEWKLKSRER